ncbi:MAG: hypothetical protein PVF56_06400 [Desulfobacterales bacterium]|jgi:hypothetical protein
MKKRIVILLILIFSGTTFFACTDKAADKTGNSEKGAIEKFTDKTAKEAVQKIRTPMNKARAVKTTGENKMKNMDEMVKD